MQKFGKHQANVKRVYVVFFIEDNRFKPRKNRKEKYNLFQTEIEEKRKVGCWRKQDSNP